MDEDLVALQVIHRSTAYSITLSKSATVGDLNDGLFEQTAVPPHLQKLLYKGKKGNIDSSTTLADAGLLSAGVKITLIGNPENTIQGLLAEEKENQRKEEILKARALKAPVKVRSTASNQVSTYRFHQVRSLQHLPHPERAQSLLERLANDEAIRHVMNVHKFTVGTLTELAPHEHPELLGLNQNAGQAILLRLRTDAYDGFRLYSEIRRVLCHELTHNVWGDHDDNFKTLNSQLNREVAEYDRNLARNTHTLLGGPRAPSSSSDTVVAEAHAHRLGGNDVVSSGTPLTPEERRRRVLDATLRRLAEEDKQIEDMCGSGHANA